MYTVSIYDSETNEHYAEQFATLTEAIIAAIEEGTGIDPFDVALGASRGDYVGKCEGIYLTIARLN